MPHDILVFLAILLFFAVVFILFKIIGKHESAATATTQLETDVVAEADKAKAVVTTDIHNLDADVVAAVHKAEGDGTVAKGTTQALVDAHTAQVAAVATAIAPTEAQA